MRLQFRSAVAISAVVLAGLILLLIHGGPGSGPNGTPTQTLVVYCAAGLQPPVAEIIKDYEAAQPVTFQTQYAGSGTLLSEIRVAGGDLFIAADVQYLLTAREMNLVRQILPVATQSPVIVVPKGNPKKIGNLDDLLANGVRLSLADPKMAAIGKVVEGILKNETAAAGSNKAADLWGRLWQKAVVHRETVNQVANDVKLTATDAGIVWDATAVQYPELQIVRVPLFDKSKNEIAVAVLASSTNPEAAQRFAAYLTAADKGLAVFRQHGYTVSDRPATKEEQHERTKGSP